MLEEALSLHRGVQGVTPVLQGDAVPGPVTSQPCGTAGSPRGGTPQHPRGAPGPPPCTCPVALVAAAPLVPAEDAGVVGAEHTGVVAARLAQGREPLVQLVDTLRGWGQSEGPRAVTPPGPCPRCPRRTLHCR